MKKTLLIILLLPLLLGCNKHIIKLIGTKSKKVITYETYNANVIMSKDDILSLYAVNKNNNPMRDKDIVLEDSIFFHFLENQPSDTIKLSDGSNKNFKQPSYGFEQCLYQLLKKGEVILFDKSNTQRYETIFSKITTSKLGQKGEEFYFNRKERWFYYFLISFGE